MLEDDFRLLFQGGEWLQRLQAVVRQLPKDWEVGADAWRGVGLAQQQATWLAHQWCYLLLATGVCMAVHTTAPCSHSCAADHPADTVAQSRQGPPLGWAAAGGGGRAPAPGEQHYCRHTVPPIIRSQGQLLCWARGGSGAIGALSAGCKLRRMFTSRASACHGCCNQGLQLAVSVDALPNLPAVAGAAGCANWRQGRRQPGALAALLLYV